MSSDAHISHAAVAGLQACIATAIHLLQRHGASIAESTAGQAAAVALARTLLAALQVQSVVLTLFVSPTSEWQQIPW